MGFDPVELRHGEVAAFVVPARGAIVTALAVRGRELMYLDERTLRDPSSNVRGGIPVLFPFAGQLPEDRFAPAGTRMRQHGFGRNVAWTVIEHDPFSVRMRLDQDADTRRQYPYGYEAEHSAFLTPRGLQVELLVENTGSRPLPLSPGWHPYFRCPRAEKAQVTGDVPGFDNAEHGDEEEFDFGLPAPTTGRARFRVSGLGKLQLEFSPEMRHMQFWSRPGRDFVCLEPFWGAPGTVNTDRRLEVPPGEARCLRLRIELLPD